MAIRRVLERHAAERLCVASLQHTEVVAHLVVAVPLAAQLRFVDVAHTGALPDVPEQLESNLDFVVRLFVIPLATLGKLK